MGMRLVHKGVRNSIGFPSRRESPRSCPGYLLRRKCFPFWSFVPVWLLRGMSKTREGISIIVYLSNVELLPSPLLLPMRRLFAMASHGTRTRHTTTASILRSMNYPPCEKGGEHTLVLRYHFMSSEFCFKYLDCKLLGSELQSAMSDECILRCLCLPARGAVPKWQACERSVDLADRSAQKFVFSSGIG